LINNLDVIVDGKFIFKQKSTEFKYRGSSNQKLVDVVNSLKTKSLVLYKLK
jgi:anaerobic ribonucleoside-triphosphate reductase activating protein